VGSGGHANSNHNAVPATAAPTECGAFGLVRAPIGGGGEAVVAIRRVVVTRLCLAARSAGGSAGCQASHGYPLRINGHLVLEDG
jgi:hypothetical protein